MLMPPVSRYMTPGPRVIAPRVKLSSARHVMSEHKIRHLPVVDGNELVGVLSDRDLLAIYTPEDRVEDAMTRHPATVTGATPLDEVIALMDTKALSSVVVVGTTGVEGIFTLVDAMRAFSDVLHAQRNSER